MACCQTQAEPVSNQAEEVLLGMGPLLHPPTYPDEYPDEPPPSYEPPPIYEALPRDYDDSQQQCRGLIMSGEQETALA